MVDSSVGVDERQRVWYCLFRSAGLGHVPNRPLGINVTGLNLVFTRVENEGQTNDQGETNGTACSVGSILRWIRLILFELRCILVCIGL